MVNNAHVMLSTMNPYTIGLIVILFLFLLTVISSSMKESLMRPLVGVSVIWAILFGYEAYVGHNLFFTVMSALNEKEESRYEKVMIDGREVIYDKFTNEVVKSPKK